MPLIASEFIWHDYTTLANGLRIPRSHVHPLLEQLELACQAGSLEEVQRILPQITPVPADIPGKALVSLQGSIRAAVEQKHHDVVRAMLQSGFLPYNLSCLAVDAAFHGGDTAMLKLFIEAGWDVNEAGPQMIMRPLLRHAVNLPDLRAFLLAHGASPNTENQRRLTPLETAVQWSGTDVVRDLLDHGGDPAKDDSLVAAAEVGNIDVADLLVSRGADVNALEKELPHPWGQRERRTALEVALERNHQDMAVWLRRHGATARNNT
ncbi:uncharacterized protein BP5553_02488 [Venustampulla echinocandica]|uniref:Uncharacterized protein n=1 Tax=Venustampulla echinocandica TaxID=2656787 RepID=A0A370U409_9HELO|nr:uncharacterized protein BP5553_02488 [Venustampulla echinocandica]RDL42509.1 hypothetical protein BP5553_02488 [Venustampulla echinocandica]